MPRPSWMRGKSREEVGRRVMDMAADGYTAEEVLQLIETTVEKIGDLCKDRSVASRATAARCGLTLLETFEATREPRGGVTPDAVLTIAGLRAVVDQLEAEARAQGGL